MVHHLTQGFDVHSGGKPLFTVDHIRQLYNEPPLKLSPDATRYLQDIANAMGDGSLRRCEMLLRNAVRRARKRSGLGDQDKVTITADDLAWVETHLRRQASEHERIKTRRKIAANAVSG